MKCQSKWSPSVLPAKHDVVSVFFQFKHGVLKQRARNAKGRWQMVRESLRSLQEIDAPTFLDDGHANLCGGPPARRVSLASAEECLN